MARRTLVVIQSRLSSSRLPGKAMLGVAGQPMVVLAARRAARGGTEVVVATSDRPEDDVVAGAVEAAGVRVVRGPLDDPLTRFVMAADGLEDPDVVVRLTADNVLPDHDLVRELVERVMAGDCDYVRVGGDDDSLPYGVAGEAFTVRALREADRDAVSAQHREHVTPWIRERYGDNAIRLSNVHAPWRGLRCTVDTFDDYVTVARLFSRVASPVDATWRDLADLLADTVGEAAMPWPRSSENALGQSPVVLGTVQLGLPYGAANAEGLPDEEQSRAVLKAAAAAGMSHVDTARAYGLSEERIGRAGALGLSEHLGVVTKILPLAEVPFDAPAAWCEAAVQASFATSLRKLGTERVDALLLHRAEDWSKGGHAVRDALRSIRDEGGCRLIGVSLSTPQELVDMCSDADCGYVQLPFNLLDWRWTAPEVQQALASRPDLVVTTRSAYLQGLLVAGASAPWPSNAGVDGGTVRSALESLVKELGRSSVADLCLAYVLGHSWVTSVVLGAETPAQVRDSAALARREPLAPDEIVLVRERVPHVSETLLDPSRWQF